MPKSLKLTVRIGGKQKTFPDIKAAAKALKLDYNVLYQRLFIMGWSINDAAKTKVRPKRKAKRKVKRKK